MEKPTEMPPDESVRQEAWAEALHACGTAYLFRRRANAARVKLRILAFAGIVVPLVVGSAVVGFGTQWRFLTGLLAVAAVAATCHIVMSVWAVTSSWDDQLGYSRESVADNTRLSEAFEKLGRNPPPDLVARFDVVQAEYQARGKQDLQRGLSDTELRRGHRAALRQFGRKCAGCNKVPTSLEPTNCPVCGQFGRTRRERADRVMKGFMRLNSEGKREFMRALNEYLGEDKLGQDLVKKSVN